MLIPDETVGRVELREPPHLERTTYSISYHRKIPEIRRSEFAHLDDAILGRFGEMASIRVRGVDHPIAGAYRAPWVGMAVGNLEVERPVPRSFWFAPPTIAPPARSQAIA